MLDLGWVGCGDPGFAWVHSGFWLGVLFLMATVALAAGVFGGGTSGMGSGCVWVGMGVGGRSGVGRA